VNASPQHPQSYNGRSVLTTAEASVISGLTREYISRLLQTGRIEGTKPWGSQWMVYADSLEAFLTQPRTPGREGPRGPRKKREVRHTEQGDRVLLSTAEAHELYGYRQDSLLRLLRRRVIEGERSGRSRMIYEDSLLAYLAARKRQPKASSSSPLSEPEPSPDE